ncbi:unnamed protein product [Parascedosporium putredinis]|uniref:Putative peptidase domain-containing protein n=1 Tax=Parascedosporium putredinis TaxID=1442378 RepID=A0A9P1HDP8_9PEZI|nr:unnamed protein product [Parascedosporium putredinis]CAI8004238.1 unnamed protein product [Parascedosporium putredinis]
MLPKIFAAAVLAHGLGAAVASPIAGRADASSDTAFTHNVTYSAAVDVNPAFPIHESCNVTLQRQLTRALDETVTLAAHAKEHILRWGGESPLCKSWAGHWRGSNATQETVICDLSFAKRRWLDATCGLRYTVVGSPLNTFWATDLLHRLLHVPQISEGAVEHFAEDYAEVLELAKTDPAKSALDSDAIQYFAIDVYAYDIAAPGQGCTGEVEEA